MLEGPASALGLGMKAGLNAAFDEINAKGGVHGRKLKLISVNDGYEPDRAIAATKKLIEDDKVFALIGPVGTPTSAAAQPIATAAKVPFMGAFTGAGFLRNPKLENVINVRASYDAETEAWVKHLTEDLKISKIAIFYQDDAFGRAGLSGFKKAMDRRSMTIAAEATYERNTDGGEVRPAHTQARRAGGGGDRRRLQAGRRVHQAVAQDRFQPGVRQHLVRRRQCAGERARGRRQGRDRVPGGAVPGRCLAQGRRRLSGGNQGWRAASPNSSRSKAISPGASPSRRWRRWART